MRSYQQYCPLAYALDLVGERWSLLIVRDLGLGPRRYVDLQRGLPGVSSNLLAGRLRHLLEGGVVRHRTLPPPASAEVYELTESGRDLLAALEPLVRWGARRLPAHIPGPQEPGDHVGAVPAMTALTLLHAAPPGAAPMTAVLRFPPDVFTLYSAGESAALRVRLGEPSPDLSAAADLDLSSDQATFMQLVAGQSTPEDAAAGGALRLHRGAERLGAWLERFRPPAAMAGPTGA